MKDIPGYESLYAITEDGKVWSYKNKRFLKTRKGSDDYIRAYLCKDKKGFNVLVHRLVAMTYLPNPDNLPEVNHKDENPSNPHVSNLEWCTREYNINYGTALQRMWITRRKK